LIEYRARFVPDFDLPPMIGMYAVQRSLERHLDALADEIERRSAGSGAALATGDPPSVPQEPAPIISRGE
jgi:hypothetical protein